MRQSAAVADLQQNHMKTGKTQGRGKLLLIDKCAVLRAQLGPALEEHGFEVSTCQTAQRALHHVEVDPPDYVLTDLVLPDLSGLTLISRMKTMVPDARVVVLTAYGSIRTAVEAVKRGAIQYLTKPRKVTEIIAALDSADGEDGVPLNGKPRSIAQIEREYINWVVLEHNGNVSAAARALSMHRRTLQRKLLKRAAGD